MYIDFAIFLLLLQLTKVFAEDEALINKKLPKELLLRIFSYLNVVELCRCAQVSKAWNVLALDGSNWQRIDLFSFQTDVEVKNFSDHSVFFYVMKCTILITRHGLDN